MSSPTPSPEHEAARLLAASASLQSRAQRAEHAERLAAALLEAAAHASTGADESRARRLTRLMADPAGQRLTTLLTDRIFRSRNSARIADQVAYLVHRHGVPKFMGAMERIELALAAQLAGPAAHVVARGVLSHVQHESRDLVAEQRPEALERVLREHRASGVAVNLNQLGEALLGEADACARVTRYEALAARNDVDALSVKVSSLGSWLSPYAFEQDAQRLAARLAAIYRASVSSGRARATVMLDMESYDDVELTLAVLERALAAPGCAGVHAGIVLQAYLPDTHVHLTRVLALARARHLAGLPALRVRLVKGANLAFERVEGARRGLPMPTFPTKVATDASYKRLLERLVAEGLGRGIVLGVASHNVFDIAYALTLRASSEHGTAMSLEMLEGMAKPLLRAVVALGVPVLTYVPICADDAMVNGIAYLVRRLDENTSADNFLRRSFGMRAGDDAFALERTRFRQAVALMPTLDVRSPRRTRTPTRGPSAHGEPDTDFAQAEARAAVANSIEARVQAPAPTFRSVWSPAQSGRESAEESTRAMYEGFDPSRPGVVPYRAALLDACEVDSVLRTMSADGSGYAMRSVGERSALLGRVAQGLRDARDELISAMVMDAGKRVVEADAEVSEAIDFAEYYRRQFSALAQQTGASFRPRGIVLVAPPWNFPLGIPAGSTFAALMAGNRVLLKPALETALVAVRFAELAWAAGVPKDVLSLVLCDDDVAAAFVRDARVASVILTGATSTARLLQRTRPGLHLAAETGGKNVFVVSAMSDREQAIRDAVQSAFGHAGQKCSATSLLVLEAEVYDDPHFMATLADAVRSLKVGTPYAADSFVTPLIHPPSGALRRALDTLAPGERWLVAPSVTPDNPRLLGPGVKVGVTEHSPDYRAELFGPVLGVMRASSFAHAIVLANGTGYGLTAGLSSLDEREQAEFISRVHVGNLYINRPTTGAVVERQPFGGYANSSFGSGAKAGGPNYVARLTQWHDNPLSTELRAGPIPAWLAARVHVLSNELDAAQRAQLARRAWQYYAADEAHFSRAHDPHAVLGQHNTFRYRGRPQVMIRVAADAQPCEVSSTVLAAELAGAAVVLSFHPNYRGDSDASRLGFPVYVETAQTLSARARTRFYVRIVGTRERELDLLAAFHGSHLADEEVVSCGRLELLHYVEEQTISVEAHRHGYLGPTSRV